MSGTLAEKKPTEAVIDVQGLGYKLLIPASSYEKLPPAGKAARLLAIQIVREDDISLYGFATEGERTVFTQMIAVSGVGPKLALAALSAMSAAEIRSVILAGDAAMLTRIPGVGRKTAERLIIELRDRIAKTEGDEVALTGRGTDLAGAGADARAGLEALGLNRAEAEKRIRRILSDQPSITTAEELIRVALRGG